jgi:hypothetical protein
MPEEVPMDCLPTTEDSVCDDKPGVRMTIEDTGVGIFPEHISTLAQYAGSDSYVPQDASMPR